MMQTRKLMVAGTGSNVGKTTVTLGLIAAYKALGYEVQGFKCGPDYIDPTFQTIISGRQARSLDSWMCNSHDVKEIFSRGCESADIAIIEGVMGMFDGKDPLSNIGSSAEIARITETPVLLVIDASGVARSAAAIVKGFQTLSSEVKLCGVVANYVGSEGHFKLIKEAVESECGVPVIGYLKRDDELVIPDSHLGLVPLLEYNNQESTFDLLSETIQTCFDLKGLYQVMGKQKSGFHQASLFGIQQEISNVRIAVAKDEAFHFYYEENLDLLKQCGAELVYFSPLHGEELPENIHGLYIGGGFPERFASDLAKQVAVKESIYHAIKAGMPTLAEGGGFMYLCEAIENTKFEKHSMVGVIPGDIKMHDRYVDMGYRTVTGNNTNFLLGDNETARGHVFHYSSFDGESTLKSAFETSGRFGVKDEGVIKERLIASYVHLHFGSNPELASRWIRQCEAYKTENPIDKDTVQLGKENLQINEETIVFESPILLKVISAGVTGAGIGYYERFLNRHVDKDYNPEDYQEEMNHFLKVRDFHPDETVSMMTAVKLKDVVYEKFAGTHFSIFIVVTAGTGNAVDAALGKEHLAVWKPGTINTWIFVNGKLSDAAFIQSIITATEAKTKVLKEMEITDEVTGTIATGTSTDSILIAATQSGQSLEFAGPISELGALIGEGVYDCITKALEKTRGNK